VWEENISREEEKLRQLECWGTAASEQRQQLEVTYPISSGIVRNW
jgi:hypothetical protein